MSEPRPLVLSIFPGLDMLGMGFEAEGFCVVRGPDVLWGGDVREFHPPRGVFAGLIGGDPCQAHSALSNLVRAKGLEPRFGDLSGEFLRVIDEARPDWFLRENVPRAPHVAPDGYGVHTFLLDNAWLNSGDGFGEEQARKRRFWFGVRGGMRDLRRHLEVAALEVPDQARTVTHEGGGAWHDNRNRVKRNAVTGAHRCHARPKGSHGERYTFAQMLRLQGLPADALEHAPFTSEGKRRLVGNGVPVRMARALARAVRRSFYDAAAA